MLIKVTEVNQLAIFFRECLVILLLLISIQSHTLDRNLAFTKSNGFNRRSFDRGCTTRALILKTFFSNIKFSITFSDPCLFHIGFALFILAHCLKIEAWDDNTVLAIRVIFA